MLSLCARLAVLAVLVLAGCTHSHPLNAASPESRSHVNARAEQKSALVTLYDGEEVRARSLHVAPDVTTWLDPKTGTMRSVPTSELASVRFTDRGRGVLEGLGLGTAIGVVSGAVVGAYAEANGDEGGYVSIEVPGAILGGAVFGSLGLLIGGIAGVDRGSYTVYTPPVTARDD